MFWIFVKGGLKLKYHHIKIVVCFVLFTQPVFSFFPKLSANFFFQISSPACTELEVVMMDWLGKALQLPEEFLSGGKGGGVIQVPSSFCVCKFRSERWQVNKHQARILGALMHVIPGFYKKKIIRKKNNAFPETCWKFFGSEALSQVPSCSCHPIQSALLPRRLQEIFHVHQWQGTASEATLVGLLAARSRMSARLKEENPNLNIASVLDKLVAYTSDQVCAYCVIRFSLESDWYWANVSNLMVYSLSFPFRRHIHQWKGLVCWELLNVTL